MADTKADGRALLQYLKSQEFLAAASNASRLVGKLETAIQKQEHYNTHQLLRTLYFRFINHHAKLMPLFDLLCQGSQHLIANNELISGQDVAACCLETAAKYLQGRLENATTNEDKETIKALLAASDPNLHARNQTVDKQICVRISLLAKDLPDTESGRPKFLAEVLRLLTPKILNRELLHYELARTFMAFGAYSDGRYHLLYCANPHTASMVGMLLADYHKDSCNKSEVDLILAQYILQFLCVQMPIDSTQTGSSGSSMSASNKMSRSTIAQIVKSIIYAYRGHPFLQDEPSPSSRYPLLNFLNFISQILDTPRPETQTFKTLCDLYKTSLARDPNFQSYLDRVGEIYFGLVDHSKQQQQQQQGGFFNNILMSLLDGGDDETDMGSEQGSNAVAAYDDLD